MADGSVPEVLIGYSACPLTQRAFEEAGVRAWTCDLLPSRGDGARHLQGDVWEALRSRRWSMAVLHPMCTYLTVSAAWAFNDPDFVRYPGCGYHQRVKPGTLTGAARRAAREEALQNFRALLDLPFPVAVENPGMSFAGSAIRSPDQIVQPFQFGDDASKATGLWLTRGLPKLRPTRFREPRLVCSSCRWCFVYGLHRCPKCGSEAFLPRWANQTDGGQNKLGPSDPNRWLARSETWPGIAAAMGAQWGRWLLEQAS